MLPQSRPIVTFLGCPVSAQTTALLHRWRRTATSHLKLPAGDPALRWTRPESLHITLHYFGPTPQAALAEYRTALGEVVQTARKIPVRLHAPTLFPHSRKARGLWMEVGDPTGALHRLQAELVQALQRLGLSCDPERFHPHVTLGRIPSRLRGARRREAVAVLRQTVAHGSMPMTADTIAQMHWYQSLPQPQGNIYKPLTTWRFDNTP